MRMRHILAVDDEPQVLELMRSALFEHGRYRVSIAPNAEDAIKTLVNDPPNAALIDAVLPGTSGIYLAGHALALGIPTLLVTGQADIRTALEEVDCPVLWKPFQIDALIASVNTLVANASQRRVQMNLALHRLMHNRGELLQQIGNTRQTIERVRADRAARTEPGD